ncbi:MAG TPA: hypothetical protein VFA46_16145 [Actinomycetes bacterium]|jgi:hypothetical protein|nr:hypothetical protein [Actinomycetes bacterium]
MPAIPESTKVSLQQRLREHARTHWPQLAGVKVRYRGSFAYVSGQLHDGEVLPLCRLRYGGSATRWGFALYLASKDGYEDAVLPTGGFAGAPRTPWTAPAACTCPALTADLTAQPHHKTAPTSTPDELTGQTTKAGQDAAGGDRDLGRGMVNLTILLVILANIFHRY